VVRAGETLSLAIEKPAAGGRMLARHEGQVVLVAGAIPGERVQAQVDRVKGGVAFASARAIDEASADRRPPGPDALCGGNVFAHIAYPRQLALKREIVRDAFTRIAHLALPADVPVQDSPERGYRMRARLHVHDGRIGFYREGTHTLCDPGSTGQLLDSTLAVLEEASHALRTGAVTTAATLDVSENVDASERVIALDLSREGREHGRWDDLLALTGVTGAVVSRGGHRLASRGNLTVRDVVRVETATGATEVALRRQVGAFFQGNRYLVSRLVSRVLTQLPDGPLLDLYAGSGLFGLAHAAAGRGAVTLVEGDRLAIEDLRVNAAALGGGATVAAVTVEGFLASANTAGLTNVLVDPPRTGLSIGAAAALVASEARLLVYVSCDVATLARDARRLVDGGFALGGIELFDLFPNTAHIETVAVFERIQRTIY
jgi:23S rRNA (uracil1939-C5)-methyltransferase